MPLPHATEWKSTLSSSTDFNPNDSNLLEVGRIGKAHGLRGEVVVTLLTEREERLDVGSVLESARGSLTVQASRPYQNRWLVTFIGHSDRTAAEQLGGTTLYAEPIDDGEGDDTLWVHQLIGATVQEIDGTVWGTVVSVEDNPAADLLVVDSGHLVPVNFVVGDIVDNVVTVDTPDGLFD